MIDPLTALAGIQSAVALVKKVSKTVDDVASLGPVLGKYFDAKSNATKALVEAKKTGTKSSMAAAIEIELAIHQAEEFEKQLQLLFMQTGKIDVWAKIKARASAMDVEAAHAARKEREAAKKRKQQLDQTIELVLGLIIVFCILVGTGWAVIELIDYCKTSQSCRR